MNAHKKTAARFLAMAFAIVLLVISATTSFAFFFNHFYIIPPSLLGETVGQLISGIVGVLLFDAATSIWLVIYLQDARTPEQRAISLVLAGFTFLGAAAASVAHLALSATGTMALDIETLDTISMIALVCVILGVIANFGGSLMYSRFSHDNKIAVRESDRSDAIQEAEDEQARLLDGLIAQGVKEQITAVAPALAREQATRLVEAFRAREMAKYAGTGQPGETAVPSTPPQPAARHTYSRADNRILKPSKKYGLSRKGHMIDESDDIEVLIRNPGYDFDAYIVDGNGVIVENVEAERERATRPTPAPSRAQANGSGYNYPANGNG